VTLGHEGAILVESGRALRLPALPVTALSAVGAGDSFLAGRVHGLARGGGHEDAFRLGLAAGTAAVLTPGTDLCQLVDVRRFAAELGVQALLDDVT
jgi:6-phosphofructokinase 2